MNQNIAKSAPKSGTYGLLALAISAFGIGTTEFVPVGLVGVVGVILMGLLVFINVPGLQLYIVQLGEKYVPSAIDVASALNIAAFNIGIAVGSVIGGAVIGPWGWSILLELER
ncbi:hypothetical protein YDYSG_14660 [Paenibacillus tyrfis]|uniref:hypothetical protein n=1 Tax=Paenibacillus tyrfis TaxID=1501230 RepID=UPI0024901C33|nr:hypothetical protein [Paenibacillus tyrfis]GLI05436.1 hypothetical protein YDYSG_14660 [Paenibacillus tyrfis]